MTYRDEATADRIMESEEENKENKDVKDKHRLTFFLFYAFGTLTQIHGNFFTNATSYWMYKFRDPKNDTFESNSTDTTDLQSQFVSSFSVVTNVSNLIFVILTVITIKRISIPTRMTTALSIFLSMFIVTLIFVPVNTDSWQPGFFGVMMAIGAILTGGSGIFLVTLIQLGSKFPPEYLPAIFSGQAICGISAALVQIFSLSIGASPTISAAVYFFIGLLFVALTTGAYYWVSSKSEFYDVHSKIVPDTNAMNKINLGLFKAVFVKIMWYCAGVVITLGASIMVHPSITSLVVSVGKGNGNKWNDVFFGPVCTFLSYNVFDLIGRELSGKIRQPSNGIIIVIISILRLSFVPMLMYCNTLNRHHLSVAFDNDYSYIILLIVFAFTNGYLVNICILCIPLVTHDPAEKVVSSILLIIIMMVGLGACALISPVLVKAL